MQAAAGDAARLKQALAEGQSAAAQRAALQAQADALQRWAPCRIPHLVTYASKGPLVTRCQAWAIVPDYSLQARIGICDAMVHAAQTDKV